MKPDFSPDKPTSGRFLPLFYTFLGAVAIEMATVPLRGYTTFMVAGVVAYILYSIYICLCLSRCKSVRPGTLLLAALLGWGLLNLPPHLFSWDPTLVSLPESIFHLFGIASGYVLWRTKKSAKAVVVVLGIILCLLYFKGYDYWIHKLNYGTWTGRIEAAKVQNPVIFQSPAGDTVRLEDFRGRYLVLDCWSASCGVCFRKFPEVEALHKRYENDPRVEVLGLFCRYRKDETFASGERIVRAHGYTFGCLSTDGKDPSLSELGVDGFPTVLIFAPDGRPIFRGSIENATETLEHETAKDKTR